MGDQEPDARGQRPDTKSKRRGARTIGQRQGPEARGMEGQSWGLGQGVRGQGQEVRGQRPESEADRSESDVSVV